MLRRIALSCRPRQVVLFQLLGTGIFAAITAVGSDDPLTTKSCALCAAINTVAIVHYFFIWRIRLQTLNIIPMARWMVRLGRYRNANARKRARGDTTVFESEDFKQQVFQNSKKTYVQEIAVDSLRHSDCKRRHRTRTQACTDAPSRASGTVTLVLMKIDEHSIAAGAQPAHDPFLAPHTAAFLQTAIVGLGSVARFFLNDLRVSDAQRGKPRVLSIALGVLSYLGATAIWGLTTANLLYQVGWPSEKTTYPAREDSEVLWALAMYSQILKHRARSTNPVTFRNSSNMGRADSSSTCCTFHRTKAARGAIRKRYSYRTTVLEGVRWTRLIGRLLLHCCPTKIQGPVV